MANPLIASEDTAPGFWRHGGETAKMRVFAVRDFRTADGVFVPSGRVSSRDSCCVELDLTVNEDLSLSIPSTDELPFTDTSSDPAVRFSAYLYDSRDVQRNAFLLNFAVDSSLGANISWDALAVFNATRRRPFGDNYPNRAQVAQMISALLRVGDPATADALGRVLMSVAPADPSHPIAVGTNDPRVPPAGGTAHQFLTRNSGGTGYEYKTLSPNDGVYSLLAGTTLTLGVEDAGAAQKGGVRLSVAPTSPTAPIAVGTNDPRLYSLGVNVAALATGGTGTEGDPYTGWDAGLTWESETTYVFSPGVFSYSTPIVILDTHRTRLVGAGMRVTRLKFTGTGIALTIKATTLGGELECGVEDLEIDGNANCTRGLMIEAQSDGYYRNVNVRNCTQAAFWVKFCVRTVFEHPRCALQEDIARGFTTVPLLGFYTEQRGGGETFQGNTIINPVFNNLQGNGMEFNNAVNCTIIGGAVEACAGNGVVVASTCETLTFIGTNNEYNEGAGGDWDISGNQIVLDNCLSVGDHVDSSGTTLFRTGANSCQVFGGRLDNIVVQSAARDTYFFSVGFNISGSGTISINDDTTAFFGHPYNISAGAANGGNSHPLTSPLNLGLSYSAPAPAWDATTYAVVNIGGAAAIFSRKGSANPGMNAPVNAYIDALGAWRYRVTGYPASNVQQFAGDIIFMVAPVGVADALITWTEVGKFDSDGKLYVNDGGGMKGVTYGANDSGGAGFKVLRVAN